MRDAMGKIAGKGVKREALRGYKMGFPSKWAAEGNHSYGVAPIILPMRVF
jgi:hypothetical protein